MVSYGPPFWIRSRCSSLAREPACSVLFLCLQVAPRTSLSTFSLVSRPFCWRALRIPDSQSPTRALPPPATYGVEGEKKGQRHHREGVCQISWYTWYYYNVKSSQLGQLHPALSSYFPWVSCAPPHFFKPAPPFPSLSLSLSLSVTI